MDSISNYYSPSYVLKRCHYPIPLPMSSWRVSYKKLELLSLRDHLGSSPGGFFSGVCVAHHFVFRFCFELLLFCFYLFLYLFVFVVCLVCHVMQVSLDCSFLIAASIFSNVYFINNSIAVFNYVCIIQPLQILTYEYKQTILRHTSMIYVYFSCLSYAVQ